MKLERIRDLLNCDVVSGADRLDIDVTACMSSDMMSDVLAFAGPGALLITGLTNIQSVRTADIADAVAIVFLRGKRPDEHTIQVAKELSIPLMCSTMGMFDACGILYGEGLEGIC